MIIRRLAATAGAVTVAGLLPALPAAAHGAPVTPISRTAACAPDGSDTGAAACKAARTANGGSLGNFDNLRVPNVNGNDRKAVPDGKLCSGGLDAYRGLDQARDDFPSTPVAGGQTLKIKYRATIAHAGSFRVYLTDTGYDPDKKLAWSDLGSKPLLDVTDPPLRDGAYAMSVKLPQRTGRQILYIVWETSSTPDTYYSCSDLAFKAAAKPAAKPPTKPAATPSATKKAVAKGTTAAPSSSPAATKAADATSEPPRAAQNLTPVGEQSNVTLGHSIIAGAVVLGAGAILWAVVGGILRRRRGN
jgi:predicted carbohydrate-binding protein with CBM5 and CBM33 domain